MTEVATKKENKTARHKQQMIEALTETMGIVTSACQKVNISRNTHYRWYNEDTEYQKQVDDIDNIALDCAEEQLLNHIKKSDITAIIFYLKTKGKRRGYIERQELTGKDGENIFGSISDGELISRAKSIIDKTAKN